jgi:hypothetical protein
MTYYRKFIKGFSEIAAPLFELTMQKRVGKSLRDLRKESNSPWSEDRWGEAQQKAFETLKGALLTRPILALPRRDRKWRLATDASNVAMGAVLSQYDEEGVEHPIAYYSRKLTDAETRWVIWELELGAVVWASTLCRHHLRGMHFELITDSKVVAALLKKAVPPRRENFLIRMGEFTFTPIHRKGELNANADFFSRWAAYKDYEEQQVLKIDHIACLTLSEPTKHFRVNRRKYHRRTTSHCYTMNAQLRARNEDAQLRIDASKGKVDLDAESKALETAEPVERLVWPIKDDTDTRAVRQKIVEQQRIDPVLRFIITKLETRKAVQAGLVAPSSSPTHDNGDSKDVEVQQTVSTSDHEGKHQSDTTALATDSPIDGDEMDEDGRLRKQAKLTTKQMAKLANLRIDRYRLVGEDGLLVKACVYRTAKLKTVTVDWPIVVPESMIPTILSLFHGDKSIIGHGGKHKTYGALRKRFVWKGMVQNIRQWIGACHKCLIRKRQVPQHQQYNVHPKAVAPMNRICIDIVGPLVKSHRGHTHILTIYDPFSHWPGAYAIAETDSRTVINCLKKHISEHSVPAEVLSDRGRNLMSAEVREFLQHWFEEIRDSGLQTFVEWKCRTLSPLFERSYQPSIGRDEWAGSAQLGPTFGQRPVRVPNDSDRWAGHLPI